MSRDLNDQLYDDLVEAYELNGYEIPPGHPDEWVEDIQRRDFQQRYYDADPASEYRVPGRESDDWLEDEDLAA